MQRRADGLARTRRAPHVGHERGDHRKRHADAQRCALTEDEGVRHADGIERSTRREGLHLFEGTAEGADIFESVGVQVCEGAWRCDARCVAVKVELLEGVVCFEEGSEGSAETHSVRVKAQPTAPRRALTQCPRTALR